MKEIIVDTNAFLRLLFNDNVSQADRVERLLRQAKKGKVILIVPSIIIFEILFALDAYYSFSKEEISSSVESILGMEYLQIEKRNIFAHALTLFKQKNLSFPDCFLASLSQIQHAELFTFDKKLKKLLAK